MKQILCAVCLAMITTQAQALSCLRPDVAQSYTWADESEDLYAVLLGQISFDDTDLTEERMQAGVTLPGRFTGVQLGPNGQSAQMTRDISVKMECLGPWCGSVSTAPNTISFVNITDAGLAITGNACGGVQFSADDPAVLQSLRYCLRGDKCKPSQN